MTQPVLSSVAAELVTREPPVAAVATEDDIWVDAADDELPLYVTALSAASSALACFYTTRALYDGASSIAMRLSSLTAVVLATMLSAASVVLVASAMREVEAPREQTTTSADETQTALRLEILPSHQVEESDESRASIDCVEACRAARGEAVATPKEGVELQHVLSFDIEGLCASETFDMFWSHRDDGTTFFTQFLNIHAKNKNACATDWEAATTTIDQCRVLSRTIETLHPLATSIRLPGLALVIPTVKTQRAFLFVDNGDGLNLAVFERSKFKDIPYADALRVETVWLFTRIEHRVTRVTVYFRCVFLTKVLAVPRLIQRLAVSKTKSELSTTYNKWRNAVVTALGDRNSEPTQPRVALQSGTRSNVNNSPTTSRATQLAQRKKRRSNKSKQRARRDLPSRPPPPPPLSSKSSFTACSPRDSDYSLFDDIFCLRKMANGDPKLRPNSHPSRPLYLTGASRTDSFRLSGLSKSDLDENEFSPSSRLPTPQSAQSPLGSVSSSSLKAASRLFASCALDRSKLESRLIEDVPPPPPPYNFRQPSRALATKSTPPVTQADDVSPKCAFKLEEDSPAPRLNVISLNACAQTANTVRPIPHMEQSISVDNPVQGLSSRSS